MQQDRALKVIENKLSDIRDCAIYVENKLREEYLNETRWLIIMNALDSAYGAMRSVCDTAAYMVSDAEKSILDDRELWDKIDEKIQKLHCELKQEISDFAFPEGREKAMQELEDRIHRMTFQNGLNGRLRADDGESGTANRRTGDA